jgi:hypothetical protein
MEIDMDVKKNWIMVVMAAIAAFALCLVQLFSHYGRPSDARPYQVGLLGLLLILNAAWFFFKVPEGVGRWLVFAALILLPFGVIWGKPLDVRYVLLATVAIMVALNSGVFLFTRR